jgi:Zn-dependent oligopeptidase
MKNSKKLESVLLRRFETPFENAPFDVIKNEDFLPTIEFLIHQTKEEIKQIETNLAAPSFENTIEALEKSGKQLDRVTSVLFNLNAAETNHEIQQITEKVSPILSAFANDITLNKILFERINEIYQNKENLDLDAEQQMLLKKTYKSFKRNGADLGDLDKNTLREIDQKLSILGLQFGKNVLTETNAFILHITNENDLHGLPNYIIENAKITAKERNLDGWVFSLQFPSYVPFMKFSSVRKLREKMYKAYLSKGFHKDECDNQKIILDLIDQKNNRAKLLGYNSHADFVLEERMVKTPEEVVDFLQELLKKAFPAAKKELDQIKQIALQEDELDDLQSWDHAYYSEKLKNKKYSLSDEILKPYFKLDNVLKGVFAISQKLYGLTFIKKEAISVYHPEVEVYEVLDENNGHQALLYCDFFPRKGKRPGAWMTSFKGQWFDKQTNKSERPHISIVCNFTKPTETTPSLLTFEEVTTLFHEFGHALHGILANTTYKSLSGTNVLWDFVELPSQFMENYCFEKDALALFAKHYQTNEVIPAELVDKIKLSSTFMEGYQTLRQVSFALLDMAWHTCNPKEISSVADFETTILKNTQFYPFVDETNISCSFAHIFQGGYAAGYYSYKWAEVLDADAFEAFKEKGIFDKKIATKFKENILSMGATKEPMELYLAFRNKKPQIDLLLKRAGLL